MPLPFHGTAEPTLTLPQSHCDEVTEVNDTDLFVRSLVAQCIDSIALCGRTLPSPRPMKHRYSELIDALGDALSDGMPAARVHGDDPWA